MTRRTLAPDAPVTPRRLFLGAHLSIAGGLERALTAADRLGCGAVQLFTKNASTWRERTLTTDEIERFRAAHAAAGRPALASHAAYLVNLASPDPALWVRSREAMVQEVRRCHRLGISWVVVHPGAHMGAGVAAGLARVREALAAILAATAETTVGLLVETTAGQGTGVGHRFEHLAAILGPAGGEARLGACLDTGHVFAAGYDIRTAAGWRATIEAFRRRVGLARLHWMHLNDSRTGLGSRVDRHAGIGEGAIGLEGFAALMNDPRLARVPKVLETPKGGRGEDADRRHLATLCGLVRRRRRGG